MTRTINGRVIQILMSHPRRGYKWLDQKTEPQHTSNGWRLVPEDEADAWAKAQPKEVLTNAPKPLEVFTQKGDMTNEDLEIEKLRKRLEEATRAIEPREAVAPAVATPKKGRPKAKA